MKPLLLCIAAIVAFHGLAFAQTAAPQTEAEYRAAETRAIKQAVAMYPEAAVKGSPFNKTMDAMATQKKASNPAYFRNPNWPILLATEVGGSLGILPAVAPVPPMPPAPAPVATPAKVQTGALFATARTGTSGFRSDQTTSGTSITQQAMHGSSVVVDYTFKQPNDAPTELQCFFMARDEASGRRFIYHTERRPAAAFDKALFSAPALAGTITSQSATPVDVTYTDGTTGTGTLYEKTVQKGTKSEGWIIRFVSSGHVLKILSNQPFLQELAERAPATFDKAIAAPAPTSPAVPAAPPN